MSRILAILIAAALLVWPAFMNGYPIVFVDTGTYLAQTVEGEAHWARTTAYGPFMYVFHWRLTLWLSLAAQGLLSSILLWLVQRVATGVATPFRHIAIATGLALLTTAPWFTATMMPDALTPACVLCAYLLGFGEARLSRAEMIFVGLFGAVAITVHLSHLAVAAGLVVLTLLLRRRLAPTLRAAIPLAMAIVFLIATNLIAFGRPSISPHGSVFLLARLQADGPATATLRRHCPRPGWYLCGYTEMFPMDAEAFLWQADSPLNRDRDGNDRGDDQVSAGERLSDEARDIVAVTLLEQPWGVARQVLRNTLRQLVTARLGDMLSDRLIDQSVGWGVRHQFPAAEIARFEASRQTRGELERLAAPFDAVQWPVFVVSFVLVLAFLTRRAAWRDAYRANFALVVLAALAGNAVATGGLSGVHDRYAARIAWLLPLSVAIAALRSARRPDL